MNSSIMKKIINSILDWLSTSIKRIQSYLEHRESASTGKSKFIDLAPTDDADKVGIYSEAILFAINNPKVSNLALTGPYGSGKSSIIQSFLKKYPIKALNVSLASFVPELESKGETISRQEIERSILQQMLYGADANKLPFSRFKRIQSPGIWSFLRSLVIVIGLLAVWFLFQKQDEIINGNFFHPFNISNWKNLGFFVVAFMFIWSTLHNLYTASYGLSLKSISLKDVEIKPANDDQESILNRHLDEIIYFFQSTKYDLVIIEDLDRFNNTEILVTLREINSLVNENSGVKRKIRFLYALRDDMFANTDRTKFFEFIIPVIPIINASNSIDMMIRQGLRLDLDKRLDRQFLREVSRYLNDLRLIQNIFNEYAIYVANLETDGENNLNANKLLAVLIYKNVYPRDFEQLHRGTGILARILNFRDALFEQGEKTYRIEIAELERQLADAEQQTPFNLKELRRIYAMALIEKIPANALGILNDRQAVIALPQLCDHPEFERLIEASRVTCRIANGSQPSVDISQLHKELDPNRTYKQRKDEIEFKAEEKRDQSLRRIGELRAKIKGLRNCKLHELLRTNLSLVHDAFESFGENGELARFLILEGFLDDTYYQYTSLFHSGRLSPNDNKFLIQIRAFSAPEPDFPLDTPKEVIAAMRNEDFRQSYVLNVKIVDTLLSDSNSYLDQTTKLFEFISSNFEHCENFFISYYQSGINIAPLLSGLANKWPKLISSFVASPNNLSHVSQLLNVLPKAELSTLTEKFEDLSEFVSDNLPGILERSPELNPDRLECLNLKIKDLSVIKQHSAVIQFMFEKGLFELTFPNLEYIYQTILGEQNIENLRKMNYTAIRATRNNILNNRIEYDFDYYFKKVLLEIETNTNEDVYSILEVIRHDMLNEDDLRIFLERQNALLPNLEEVPDKLHKLLFDIAKIEPTWANCILFLKGEKFEADTLLSYLNRDDVRATILCAPVSIDTDSKSLRLFLFEADSLSDTAYKEYISALPNALSKIPKQLKLSKIKILIDQKKILFSKENLDALVDNTDLQLLFVASNVKQYLKDPENFGLDDIFREKLLHSDIDQSSKLGIVNLIELNSVVSHPERASIIGPILNVSGIDLTYLPINVMQSLIIHSKPIGTQISLFNKCYSMMTDDDLRSVLANLPKPFSDITTGYHKPRLVNSPENLQLVNWLQSRGIISSWSESTFLSNELKVNLYRNLQS